MNLDDRLGRILYCNTLSYLDSSSGAAVASRCMMEKLHRLGFAVEAFTGGVSETHRDQQPDTSLVRNHDPAIARIVIGGVSLTTYSGFQEGVPKSECPQAAEFLATFDAIFERFRPHVLINFGGDPLSAAIRAFAKSFGALVVFPIHNLDYFSAEPFTGADAVIVPSRYAADHYRQTLGLDPIILPNAVNLDRAMAVARDPKYLTFVNPSHQKGVYVFARIADELALSRLDIPLLVVESRGSERTLAGCGLDLAGNGNVSLMSHTSDPRQFWGVTKLCLMPSLCRESQGLVAVEAMLNGIPVVASDRGALPETLGRSGVILSLPEWMSPRTRVLPTAREVRRWVDEVIDLWDDPVRYEEQRNLSFVEASRWKTEVTDAHYGELFRRLTVEAYNRSELQ